MKTTNFGHLQNHVEMGEGIKATVTVMGVS